MLINEPASEVEMAAAPAPVENLTPPAPLGRLLSTTQPIEAEVPEGMIRVPAGMDVELHAEHSESVDVTMGNGKRMTVLTLPRDAVINRGERPVAPLPIFAPIVRATRALADFTNAPASSFSVEAKEIGTGAGTARSWETNWGSYERNTFRTKGIEVRVRNLSRRASGDLRVTVYWIGRNLKDNRQHVTHAETFNTSLRPVSETSVTSWCPILDSSDRKYVALGERYRSGSKFDGWFVLVERAGEMLVGRGATEAFNTLIRDSGERQTLVATWAGSKERATSSMPSWRKERPGFSAIPKERTTIISGTSQ